MWKQMNHNDSQSTFVTVIEAYQPDEASPLPTTRLNADKGLPALPSESLEVPRTRESRPVSTVPTASSIYSQPSPEMNDYMDSTPVHEPRSSSLYPEDVSPPDSPLGISHGGSHSRKSSFNVSPISTENPSPFTSRSPTTTNLPRYASNLPVPKKNLKKFWKLPDKGTGLQDQETGTVRWDEYSGEPTYSDKGKPPSTTPGAVRLNEDPHPRRHNGQNFGTSTHISGGGNSIPRKRVGNRDISDTPIIMRPEWKGAGGRHAIVAPPVDKPLPLGRQPQFPPGFQKKRQMEEERAERERLERVQREREQAEREREQAERERLERVQREREQAERERLERVQREREQAEREKLERVQRERERAEQQRIENELQEHQRRDEEERQEIYRRELERAEQARIERERAEQDRRIKERVMQARRERDLVLQAQKERETAAKAQVEKERVMQSAQIQAPRLSETPSPRFDDRTSSSENSPSPSPNLDSPQSVSTQASHVHSKLQNNPKFDGDIRSPLARNPSNEEMKERRSPHTESSERSRLSPDGTMRVASAQSSHWQPPASNLSKGDHAENDSSIIENRFRAEMQNVSLSDEPKSRFSATTYATTNFTDSPPATPEMPSDSPPIPQLITPNSIMSRRRPLPPAGIINSRATARKPTPSDMPGSPLDPNSLNSKSLPKEPADAPKIPPVQTLQAKQDALRRRKRNIETVIHELTEVVQPSSIAYDVASRQEIKRTVEQLKRELADVIKDEYETGLKLHRAWKRQDDGAVYEPTSIWVRRVTT